MGLLEIDVWRVWWQQQHADLHTAQLMPLPLTVYCFSTIQIGFTFLLLGVNHGFDGVWRLESLVTTRACLSSNWYCDLEKAHPCMQPPFYVFCIKTVQASLRDWKNPLSQNSRIAESTRRHKVAIHGNKTAYLLWMILRQGGRHSQLNHLRSVHILVTVV